MAGRPTTYSPEIADRICRELAAGKSLRKICEADDMPAKSTILGWVIDDRDGFSVHYARAREVAYLGLADEILDISDDSSADWTERDEGLSVNAEAIQRSRLRVDTRKWVLSKMLPKVYGDRLDLTHTGKDGGPIKTEEVGAGARKLDAFLSGIAERSGTAGGADGE